MTHMYDAFNADERSGDRYSVSIDTMMRELGQADQPLHIADISGRGFGGHSPHAFRPPCVVSVALPGIGDVKARVVWTGSGRIGGQFLMRIALEALIAALEQ